MEQVYLKGVEREWHSEKVKLNSYFESYSDQVSVVVQNEKICLKSILNSVLNESIGRSLTKKEVMQLEDITNINHLKPVDDSEIKGKSQTKKIKPLALSTDKSCRKLLSGEITRDKNLKMQNHTASLLMNEKREETGKFSKEIGSKSPFSKANISSCIREENNLSTSENNGKLKIINSTIEICPEAENKNTVDKVQPNSLENDFDFCNFKRSENVSKYKNSILTCRSELLLNTTEKKNIRNNLVMGKDFLVSFRIHEPFAHNENSRIENFMQEILVLGDNTLEVLRDKIICQSDFQDIQGDLSEKPDTRINRMSRDVYKSALFYFDNTFYIDSRQQGNVDYSSVIKEWARPRGIAVGPTQDMALRTVGELEVRFGYPYLYVHQGCCEHLVIVNDARLLSGKDSLISTDYPLLSRLPPYDINRCCFICHYALAWWIVVGSERMLHDVTFMCKKCFKNFHYIDGQKFGNFKAYRYFQKNVLL